MLYIFTWASFFTKISKPTCKRPNSSIRRTYPPDRSAHILWWNSTIVIGALCFVELLPQWSFGQDKTVFRPFSLRENQPSPNLRFDYRERTTRLLFVVTVSRDVLAVFRNELQQDDGRIQVIAIEFMTGYGINVSSIEDSNASVNISLKFCFRTISLQEIQCFSLYVHVIMCLKYITHITIQEYKIELYSILYQESFKNINESLYTISPT